MASTLELEKFVVADGASQTGTAFNWPSQNKVFGVVANGSSGAFTATVKLYGSTDGVNFDTTNAVHTFTMSGTATTAEVVNSPDNSSYLKGRADVTAFTGTGATCDVSLSL